MGNKSRNLVCHGDLKTVKLLILFCYYCMGSSTLSNVQRVSFWMPVWDISEFIWYIESLIKHSDIVFGENINRENCSWLSRWVSELQGDFQILSISKIGYSWFIIKGIKKAKTCSTGILFRRIHWHSHIFISSIHIKDTVQSFFNRTPCILSHYYITTCNSL